VHPSSSPDEKYNIKSCRGKHHPVFGPRTCWQVSCGHQSDETRIFRACQKGKTLERGIPCALPSRPVLFAWTRTTTRYPHGMVAWEPLELSVVRPVDEARPCRAPLRSSPLASLRWLVVPSSCLAGRCGGRNLVGQRSRVPLPRPPSQGEAWTAANRPVSSHLEIGCVDPLACWVGKPAVLGGHRSHYNFVYTLLLYPTTPSERIFGLALALKRYPIHTWWHRKRLACTYFGRLKATAGSVTAHFRGVSASSRYFYVCVFQLAYHRANPNAALEAAVEEALGIPERQTASRLSVLSHLKEEQPPPRSPRSVGQLLDQHDAAAVAGAPSLSPLRGFRASGGGNANTKAFVPAASNGPRWHSVKVKHGPSPSCRKIQVWDGYPYSSSGCLVFSIRLCKSERNPKYCGLSMHYGVFGFRRANGRVSCASLGLYGMRLQ